MALTYAEGCKEKGSHQCALLPRGLGLCCVAYGRLTRSIGVKYRAKEQMQEFGAARRWVIYGCVRGRSSYETLSEML